MKYHLLGGGSIEAATDLGLIEALQQESKAFTLTGSIEDFMNDVAARCKTQTGADVSSRSVTTFLVDLVAGGFLIPAA
jgi:hypothetical protein